MINNSFKPFSVLLLEKMKEQIGAKLKSTDIVQNMDVSPSSSEDDEELLSEEFLDWRAKKGHK